jgi:hypothetical protein
VIASEAIADYFDEYEGGFVMEQTTTHQPEKRGGTVLGWLFKFVMAYLILVFGGGTLMQTTNPTAKQVGQIMHTVTLVDPTIKWADAQGLKAVASGLRGLAEGVPLRSGS